MVHGGSHLYVIYKDRTQTRTEKLESYIRIRTAELNDCMNMGCRQRLLAQLKSLYNELDVLKNEI